MRLWKGLLILACSVAVLVLSACVVDSGLLEGQPCTSDGRCASGYTCVREACGEGYLCPVCRSKPAPDGQPDGGLDGDDGGDGGDPGGDQPVGCDQAPPPCKSLPACTDVAPTCIDDVWVCETGYEPTERSCDFLDNDCDGQTDVGLVCRLAGAGEPGLADGAGDQARFNQPSGLLALPTGDVAVADRGNHAVRLVSAAGNVSTLAGSGQPGHQDGTGDQALFREPTGLALGPDGALLVADRGNHRIRRVTVAGEVTTLAGSGFAAYADGPADQARFAFPTDVAVAADGAIYVADSGNHCIRRIFEGQVSTFAGRCGFPGLADGQADQARFNGPSALLTAGDDWLYVAEESGHRIRVVGPDGSVSTLAGDGEFGWRDGAPDQARFANPSALAEAPSDGRIWVADSGNHRIRAVGAEVTTEVGSGQPGAADGPPALVELNRPRGVAFTANGRLVIADTNNHWLRVLTP